MRMSTKKQTADPTRPTRHGHPNSFLEVDEFSTKIGEIEANFLFVNGQFPTNIGEIESHFFFENESFPTKMTLFRRKFVKLRRTP